jgi:hypothetical protein
LLSPFTEIVQRDIRDVEEVASLHVFGAPVPVFVQTF